MIQIIIVGLLFLVVLGVTIVTFMWPILKLDTGSPSPSQVAKKSVVTPKAWQHYPTLLLYVIKRHFILLTFVFLGVAFWGLDLLVEPFYLIIYLLSFTHYWVTLWMIELFPGSLLLFKVLGGVLLGSYLSLYLLPLKKDKYLNEANPKKKTRWEWFTEVTPGRSKVIMRGGSVVRIIHGDEKPYSLWRPKSLLRLINLPWALYELYCYYGFGLYVIGIPKIQEVYTYGLRHYKVREVGGKKEFDSINEGAETYWSDHVRYAYTTWYFEFSGSEVETLPVTVKGSVQIRIDKNKVHDALFGTDSWHKLLDQAITSVMRGVMRSQVTVDDLIGAVTYDKSDLFAKGKKQRNTYDRVRKLVQKRLGDYEIEGKSLGDLVGLYVDRVDIIDFEPELDGELREALLSAVIERQKARGREIAGAGEAAYQKKVLEVINSFPDMAKANVWAEAFVKASANGGVDALLSAFLAKLLPGKS